MFFKVSWHEDFDSLMMFLWSKYGKELFTLDGIGKQMDLHAFSKSFFSGSGVTADVSVDANANVVAKTGIEYNFEMSKPLKRYNSYFLLWKELRKMYGLQVANEIIEAQLTGDIYINDFSSVSEPYCFNYSTYDIACNGLKGLSARLNIEPPKSLATFFRQVEQFIAIAANSTLGATGLADLLIVASKYVDKIKETGKDGHVKIDDVEVYAREQLTSLIYTLNWSFRANQSPFSNCSLYDNTFLESLCPDYQANPATVKLLQKIYCEVMNAEMRRTPLTFPVTTACFAVDENKEIADKEFLRFIAEQNQEYGFINIYNGSTATLSSCCFSGDTRILWYTENWEQRLTTMEEMWKESQGNKIYVPGPSLTNSIGYREAWPVRVPGKKLLRIHAGSHHYDMTVDHLNPQPDGGDKRADKLKVGDKLLVVLDLAICDKTQEARIKKIEPLPDVPEWVYCVDRRSGIAPYFALASGLLTHNCRLRSNRDNPYFNSFGAGSTKIGSLGVVTANLPRAAYKAKGNFYDFISNVKNLFEMSVKINSAKRRIVGKRISIGAAPLYTHGYMDLKKQYSTFGIVGVNEAAQLLGYDILSDEGQECVKSLLASINKWIDDAEKEENAPHNCEQVPAESSAIKLAQKDKYVGYDIGKPLYSNQFIPLTTKADMYDRLRLQGMFDSMLSGGAIAHINIGTPISDAQTMIHLMEYAAKQGVVYWAVNYRLYCCENRHTWVGGVMCPVCGKHWENEISRVVGFFTTVKNWHKVRREQDWPSRQFYGTVEADSDTIEDTEYLPTSQVAKITHVLDQDVMDAILRGESV